jgi:hypothetical protein
MAKRKKAQQRKRVIARGKARKASKSVRGKAAKRTVSRPKIKRAVVKKVGRKKVQLKQPRAPEVETVIVDVIEQLAPGVITVTEFEETEVTKPGWDETGG